MTLIVEKRYIVRCGVCGWSNSFKKEADIPNHCPSCSGDHRWEISDKKEREHENI
jgi:hypothetical protein